MIVSDNVIFVEDDLITSHGALVVEVFLHADALSPTKMPTLNLVYVDSDTRAVVPVNNVPHKSKVTSSQGKYWLHAWEEPTDE